MLRHVRYPYALSIVLICLGLAILGQCHLDRLTAPGEQVHCLAQWELSEGNLCLAVLPATVDADGALELWYAVKTETKIRKLLRLRGAPPIPSPTPAPTPTPRPATQWA